MITISAQIDWLKDAEILNAFSNIRGNNISSYSLPYRSSAQPIKKPFIFGSSSLGENATFEKRLNYFMGRELSDENGFFSTPYEISVVSSAPLEFLSVSFDTRYGTFPESVKVTYNTNTIIEYICENSVLDIKLPQNEGSKVTLTIAEWNTPFSPFIISGMSVGVNINVDKRNLISFDRDVVDRADVNFPSFGIISNKGNIKFKDIEGKVKDYIASRVVAEGMRVQVYLNNTLSKTQEKIGEFSTNEWSYDELSQSVTVPLTDGLERWQNIQVGKYPLRVNETALDIYDWLTTCTPDIEAGLDEETYKFLANYFIKYNHLEGGTLWNQWNKLCEACGLHIYKNSNGDYEVVHSF